MTHTILDRYIHTQDRIQELSARVQDGDILGAFNPARIKGRVTNDTNWLLDYTDIYTAIIDSLGKQRTQGEGAGLSRFRTIEEHTAEKTMSEQGPSIFYYIQRAFSLPEDYMYRPTDFPQNRDTYIHALVLQPELIPDKFCVDLGLMEDMPVIPKGTTRAERSQLQRERIIQKINLIPKIKSILAHAISLQTGIGKRATGRILRIPDGKYLVFQERRTKSQNPRYHKIDTVPHIHQDIYSLVRGQLYGVGHMKDNRDIVVEILSGLGILLYAWKGMSEDAAEQRLAHILERLDAIQSPDIIMAGNKIMSIDLRHAEKDNRRIQGAYNLVRQYLLTNAGKKGAISHQISLLESQLHEEEAKFDFLRNNLLTGLKLVDNDSLIEYLGSTRGDELPQVAQGVVKANIDIFRSYLYTNQGVGSPFAEFYDRLASYIKGTNKNPKDMIRTLLKCVLLTKIQSYWLYLHRLRNQIKVSKKTEISDNELIKLIEFLETPVFLQSLQLNPSAIERFAQIRISLERVSEGIRQGDIAGLSKILDEIIEHGYPV